MASKSSKGLSSTANSLAKMLIAGILAANLIVAALICFSLYQSRLHYLEVASISTRNISQQLDENITGIFAKVDAALLFVAGEAEHQLAAGAISKPSLDSYIVQAQSRLPEVATLRVTDSSGEAIYGPEVKPATPNPAQREYFSTLKKSPDAGLVFSKPIVCSITGKRTIVLARRINRPDGTFAGVVYAGITTDFLINMFSKLDVGPHGSISLYEADFDLVVRHSQYKAGTIGDGYSLRLKQFLVLVQAGQKTGTYGAKSGIDSLDRIISFRRLASPFYVLAGAAKVDFLHPWRVETTWMGLFMALFLAITSTLTLLFIRAWNRCREAEVAALKSDNYFRSFVEQANDVIFSLSTEGIISYASPKWQEAFGYPPAETIGNSFMLFVHPEDTATFLSVLGRVLKTGDKQSDIECRVLHKNGNWIWYSVNAALLGDAEGVSILGIGRDISERKQALAALQESEARFKNLLMYVPSVAVQGYGPDGITQYWNQASEKLYGYSAQEALGRNLVDLIIPPEMREDVVRAVQHMAETGEPIPASELALMRKDGSLVSVFSSHVIVKMPGCRQELFCLDIDLSERKKVEEELQQNRNLLQAVIEGTTDAVYVKDTDGRYLLFNSSASRITGKSTAEVLGRDDISLFPPADARAMMAGDRSAIEAGRTMICEDVITDAQGKMRTYLSTKGPLYRPDGSIIGTFGISRDVTEQMQWREQILQLNETLDERVQQRTLELETALREQEAFSYSVSHDLRSPLRAVNGYLAILVEDFGAYLPPEAQPYLNRSREASVTMGKLIDDLLELARVSRAELVKVAVDLSTLATRIIATLQECEPDREVEIVIAQGLTAQCDQGLLTLVLENLLGNAWKYSSREQKLRLEVGKYEDSQESIFFVKDNGIGFEMQYHDKVFGVFHRLHRQEYEGTGIGLATVKRIMERHGGSVWADAELGKGATFSFKFP